MKVEDGMTAAQRVLQGKLEERARTLARLLDRMLNTTGEPKVVGFAVLLFAFGEPPQPATWISNAEREDMIFAVEEWLARAKARQ